MPNGVTIFWKLNIRCYEGTLNVVKRVLKALILIVTNNQKASYKTGTGSKPH